MVIGKGYIDQFLLEEEAASILKEGMYAHL